MTGQLLPDAIDIIRVTPEKMLEELDREIGIRKAKFPEWIEAGRLDDGIAKLRLARLQAARNVLWSMMLGGNATEQTIEEPLPAKEGAS